MIGTRYELYRNTNMGQYPYTVFRECTTKADNLAKDLIVGTTKKPIFITGIPDGISEFTNVALTDTGATRRLTVSSIEPLNESEIEEIENKHRVAYYPIPTFKDPLSVLIDRPNLNFVMPLSSLPPTSLSRYVECRYFLARHIPATIMFNPYTGHVHRFVPPSTNIVLIMPENFTKTGTYSGLFVIDENIIVRVYSKKPLSASIALPDHDRYSEISIYSSKTLEACKRILSNLGLHRIIYQSDNQIYGVDSFVTAVIGDIANINLPKNA